MEITLHDGRQLAYAEYGDPTGFPVFFFHGIPGSRIFRPPFDNLTAKMGIRLICVDRPGYGLSTFQPNRRILDWPKDVTVLADHLGLDKFAVAGHSGGGPYVCACAYALPERVTCAAILSGLGPAEAPEALKGMNSTNAMGFRVGRLLPWPLWRALFRAWFGDVAAHPEILFPGVRPEHVLADNEILQIPGILEMCRASISEAFRSGTDGHAWEGKILARPWDFDLGQIRVPVHLWHGELDKDAPVSMGRHVAGGIPGCKAHFIPGEGHLLLMKFWQEILATITDKVPIS
jgi:pimeloyl-ACP methyl ester carboxylesterase